MSKTLVSMGLWALAGWLAGVWLGAAAGWALFALGMAAMVLVSGWQLARISRWARNVDDPPPHGTGPWDEILAPVYRRLKHYRQDRQLRQRSIELTLLAAEALPDGALTLAADKTLLWCNQTAARHLGLNLAKDRGHSILNVVREPEFASYTDQAAWDKPLVLRLGRGEQARTLSLQLTLYASGQFLLVTRDISQLEKLEMMRKDFVANVSHELRTPLCVLRGYIETMQDMSPPEAQQYGHYLQLMANQAANMQSLVADLLTLSTLESTPEGVGEPVYMAELVENAVEQARILAPGAHQFELSLDENLQVLGKASELASAVANLLTNAVHYTPPGGRIAVSWQGAGAVGATLRVEDSGIGIGPLDIPRLTERFFRVDRGRSRATGGTGLGLAIIKHVALRHEARLEISSTLGAGSSFSLVFPGARLRAASPSLQE